MLHEKTHQVYTIVGDRDAISIQYRDFGEFQKNQIIQFFPKI